MEKYASFAGIRNRRARAQARQGICLRDAGIAKKTQGRSYLAVTKLCKVVSDVSSVEDMDDQIADWIEMQFHKGAPLNLIGDALSGIHYFLPSTRKRLPVSWKQLAVWRKMEVPSRARPLPADLCWAMMSRAVQRGHMSMAALLGLGFDCFLPTGELLSIRPLDLLLRNGKGLVTLPASKGGTRHNVKESATIQNPKLLVLLEELVLVKKEANLYRAPIWTGTGTQFRRQFHDRTKFFRVDHLQFRPCSLRRGGATAYFNRTGLMEQTLLRGRWASVSVARLYLCDALAQLAGLVASPSSWSQRTVPSGRLVNKSSSGFIHWGTWKGEKINKGDAKAFQTPSCMGRPEKCGH